MSGERYDFVLNANREIGNYMMYFFGDVICQRLSCHQVAILHYKGAEDYKTNFNDFKKKPIIKKFNYDGEDEKSSTFVKEIRELNPHNKGTETNDSYCIASLDSAEPDDDSLLSEPDQQIYISYDFYEIDNNDYHRKNLYGYYQVKKSQRQPTLQLNHISFKMPQYPLQTQYDMIDEKSLCNETSIVKNCEKEHCLCTQVLQVRLNSTVELIIIDKGKYLSTINHPMHLHGVHFRVVAMEKLNDFPVTVEKIKRHDQEGRINRKLNKAPLKDTLSVPSGGYTVIRFLANNPGWYSSLYYYYLIVVI